MEVEATARVTTEELVSIVCEDELRRQCVLPVLSPVKLVLKPFSGWCVIGPNRDPRFMPESLDCPRRFYSIDHLESGGRDLLRFNHSVIAKRPDTVANPHHLGKFLEFHKSPAKI